MNIQCLGERVQLDKINDLVNKNSCQEKDFFEIIIPNEAKFELSESDWQKLKTSQKGHRFQRGEWEDYFVTGLKQSNKYCVFAFKDHYVNQSNVRRRYAKMQDGQMTVMSQKMSSIDKKLFSASGYCVFEDCSTKFCLKMNDKLVVHVFYTGKIKHSTTEVNARHFRGKSREELKDILKNSTPTKEYLNRICSSNIIAGNADYIGKSSSVYKKISAEAKDCYQSLITLRDIYLEKSSTKPLKGYIHLIQHIPGSIVFFNHEQCSIFNSIQQNQQHTLFIYQFRKNLISTTINSNNFQPCELSLCKDQSIVPLSCMLTTENDSRDCLTQWLGMFYRKTDNKQTNFNFVTDFSINMVESVLEVFGLETYESYCEKIIKSASEYKILVKVCQNQFLYQLDKILKTFYSFGTNYTFGMHAFSCLINSENMAELEQTLYSIMIILYNKNINCLVENSFNYLKKKLAENEKKNDFFVYNISKTQFVSGPEYFCPKFKADFVFCHFCEKIFEKCINDSSKISQQGIKNSRQSHKLLYNFIKTFSYTIPLWTRLTHVQELTLTKQYTRFENLTKSFTNLEKVDHFIKKYEEFNKESVSAEFNKITRREGHVTRQSIIDILVNEPIISENFLVDSHTKIKNSKNELIKPKMVKKLKKNQDSESDICFNLVSLNDSDELEKEIVIERQHHIVSNEFGLELAKEDLDALDTGSILNSNLIQFYLKLIKHDCSDSVFIYPLSFYPNLKYGFNENAELNENFNLFKFELVLVPIQKKDHWALAVSLQVDYYKSKNF